MTATDPAGQPLLFEIEVDGIAWYDDWHPLGMRATDSRTARLDLVVDGAAQVGGPNAYVGRPGFWHGGIGVAACWHGLARRLARDLECHAMRADTPFISAAAGRAAGVIASVTTVLAAAGRQIDRDPDDEERARRRAQLVRVAVAESCQTVLDESVRARGAGALCFDAGHTRAVADLTVYLRQLHHGHAAAAVTSLTDEDWWSA